MADPDSLTAPLPSGPDAGPAATPAADPPEAHPPQGGWMMALVVVTICFVYTATHVVQVLPYILRLSAEQKASLAGTFVTPDNMFIAAVSFFLGSSQGGRALMDRLSKRATGAPN